MSVRQSEQGGSILERVKSRRGKLIAVAVIAAIILLSSILVFTSATKDHTPVGEWIQAERDNMGFISERWQASLGEWGELWDAMGSQPFTITADISGSLEEGDLGLPDRHLKMMRQVLDRGILGITAEGNPAEGRGYVDASLTVYGMNLLSARLFHSGEQTGLRVPQLFDYYLLFDADGFGNAVRLFASNYGGPEELRMPEWTGTERLLDYLEQNVKDDYVVVTPGVSYDSPEGSVAVKQLNISMTPEEADDFFRGLLQSINEDTELKNVADSFAEVVTAVGMVAGIDYGRHVMITDLSEVLANERQIHFPEGFEMVLLLDDGGRIVNREVFFRADDAATGEMIAAISFQSASWEVASDEADASGTLEVAGSEDADTLVLDYRWSLNPKGEGTAEDLVVYAGEAAGEQDLLKHFELAVNRVYHPGSETIAARYDTDLRVTFPSKKNAGMEVRTAQKFEQDLSNRYHVSNTDIDLKVRDPYFGLEKLHLLLNLDMEVQLAAGTGIPEPDMDGSVNLSEIDKQEWSDVLSEIRGGLADYLDRFRFMLR